MFHPRDAELEVPLTLKMIQQFRTRSDMANRDDHIRFYLGDRENKYRRSKLLQV